MKPPERPEVELYRAALALPPEQRAAFLERACAGNGVLRRQIESLLESGQSPDAFFSSLTMDDVTRRIDAFDKPFLVSNVEQPGERIGRYKLIQQIGEGGMGSVWMAEQTEPVRRRVALKVIKLGMDTVSIVARFEAERQALALMDHPNIARVLDGGATEQGRPYFVMELVGGIPITAYCDQHKLDTAQRLDLFVQVCHAIQHAHQKGIIHRDIKPSNILVHDQDGVPVPKVIDFGIAKATGAHLTDKTALTQFEQFVGTPAYTSPEQAEMTSLDIDTRSDIYSLGVLLYELLTGKTPFDGQDLLASGLMEMRRIIREQEPVRPSARVDTFPTEEKTTTALKRGHDVTRLAGVLRGDLDWIVMKCLEKDRVRRYETANGLAADIRRYQQHEPVSARPPSVVYLMQKTMRRHKLAFAAGTAIALTLVAGIVVSSGYAIKTGRAERAALDERGKALDESKRAREAERQARAEQKKSELAEQAAEQDRDRALRAEAKATTEREVAEEILEFLRKDLLAQASPVSAPEPDLKLRTVLDRASEKIKGRLASRPLAEAGLRSTLARTYGWLGEFGAMERHAQRALELYQRELGETNVMTLAESCRVGEAYWREGNHAAAIQLLTQTLETTRRVLGPDHVQTLVTMSHLASAYQMAGRSADAIPLFEETLKIRESRLGREHPDTLASMSGLASALRAAGRVVESLPLHEEAWKLHLAKLGPEHPDTLASMNGLAAAYRTAGRPADAAPLYEAALKLQQKRLGPDHPSTLQSMDNLAAVYQLLGRQAEALPLAEETLKLRRAKLGPEHPDTVASMNTLAFNYCAANRPGDALPLFDETLKISREKFGPEHARTLLSLNGQAMAYHSLGRLAESETAFRNALAVARKPGEGGQPAETALLASVLHHLAEVLLQRKSLPEAHPLAAESVALYQRHPEWPAAEIRHAWNVQAAIQSAEGDAAGAAQSRAEAAKVVVKP